MRTHNVVQPVGVVYVPEPLVSDVIVTFVVRSVPVSVGSVTVNALLVLGEAIVTEPDPLALPDNLT
jgi:hypothetical protein